MSLNRCGWESSSEKMTAYHDKRWCKPEHEERELFAMLILEGAQAGLSEQVSKDLKSRGFNFVGPTIIYSYLQGIGIYNDHLESCDFR